MKNVRLTLIVILCAVLLCSAACLVACQNDKIVELRVENPKISFMRGDTFETGENFKVYADYKDSSSVDVTADAEIRPESNMDMNVPGDYQITVAYGSKRTLYTVYVNDSEDVLRKIELDSSNVKKQYKLGDKISLEGLVINLTYETVQGIKYTVPTSSMNGFDVNIAGENDVVISDVFTALGSFTVTVSQRNIKASFDVTVDGVNISTVQGALAVGGYYNSHIVSGNLLVEGAFLHYGDGKQPGEPYIAGRYEYKFGNNYTYFKENYWQPYMEYHCSVDNKGFFVTYLEGGRIQTSNRNNAAMMGGAPIFLWYSSETEYGAENALNNLYSHALRASNNDLKETADESARTYSFSFSGLEFRDSNADYYETTVTFKLGEDYAVTDVKIDQYYYENNSSLSEMAGYVPSFTTDPNTGITTPGAEYTYRTIVTLEQTSGERTAENEYNRDMFNVASYNMKYNGEVLNDESVIALNAGNIYIITLTDVLPTTASFSLDLIYFDFEGNTGKPDTWLINEHFGLLYGGNQISISAKHGGTWTLLFKTENITKKLTINVTGEPPEDMQAKLLNNVSGTFYDGNDKTVVIGGEVYFYGAVNSYANKAQHTIINSDNAEYATITAAVKNGIDCWKFTATQPGVYQIYIISDVAALVRCIVTFTVSEAVDYSELLIGTYTTQDRAGDIYRVTFAMTSSENNLSGTVQVSRTPTDLNNNPLTDQTVTQTLSLYTDEMSIIVDNDENNQIWVEFDVDENGNLRLIDQRSDRYVLNRE